MATYYVSKAGDDSDDGTTPALAKLTIAGALAHGSLTSGDTIEIIDEGSYNEGALSIAATNLTIKHTASNLGRPKIYGTGLGGSAATYAFTVSAAGATYQGLEISNYSSYLFNKVSSGYDTFSMSDCFVHDTVKIGSHNISNSSVSDPTTISQCVLYFENAGSECIRNNGYMEISNCLITSSNSTSSPSAVLIDYSNNGTASFSTIINRGTDMTNPILRFAKAINCIVSGSGKGIASDDHTYNLVNVSSTNFRNFADGSDGSAGTGESDLEDEDPLFVDGDSVGSSVTIAPNYDLQSTSPAFNAGIAYDSIVVDITGSTRPFGASPDVGCFEFVQTWLDYADEEEFPFSTDFTNNYYSNMNANQKFRYPENPKQVPFSRGVKGPATLRGRNTPYKAE